MDSVEERILGLEKTIMTLIGQIDTLRRRLERVEHSSKTLIVEMSPGSLGSTQSNLGDLTIPGSPIPRHPNPYDGNVA
jgi:hypothetical protein